MKKLQMLVAVAAALIASMAIAGAAQASTVPTTPPPVTLPVPDLHYLASADATSALRTAGLSYQVTQATDSTCNNLGDVLRESPTPGTVVPRGSIVTLSIGARDARTPCPSRASILLLNVGWDAHGSVPASVPDASNKVFTFLHGTMDTWFNQASQGAFPGFAITNGGTYKINVPSLHVPDLTCDDSFRTQVVSRAELAAALHGVNVASYNRVVIAWSSNVCRGFSGVELHHGTILLQGPGAAGPVAIHEFGHALGLSHSGALTCKTPSGTPVALSATNCTANEYGDRFSGMGGAPNIASPFAPIYAASQLNQLGWLNGRFETVQGNARPTLQRTIQPLGDRFGGLHAIKLLDGQQTLWLEYRQPVGLDAGGYGVGPGLIVHQQIPKTDAAGGGYNSLLLDLQPGPGAPDKFDLPVGQTWVDPLGHMQVTLDSVDAAGAHVTLSPAPVPLVTVPEVRGLTTTQMHVAFQAAGLSYTQTAYSTSTCKYVGHVVHETPSPGTRVLAGTAVTVLVGERDKWWHCL